MEQAGEKQEGEAAEDEKKEGEAAEDEKKEDQPETEGESNGGKIDSSSSSSLYLVMQITNWHVF